MTVPRASLPGPRTEGAGCRAPKKAPRLAVLNISFLADPKDGVWDLPVPGASWGRRGYVGVWPLTVHSPRHKGGPGSGKEGHLGFVPP